MNSKSSSPIRLQKKKASVKKHIVANRANDKGIRNAMEDHLPCLLFRTKYDGRLSVVFLNKYFKDITGYSQNDYEKGKSLLQLIHPDDKRVLMHNIERAFKEKDPFVLEHRLVKKNGSVIWVRAGGGIVTDLVEKQSYVDGYMMDITESKNLEDSIIESESRFRTIFEGGLDGILVMELKTLRMVAGNHSMCDMLGYSLKELLTLRMDDIHPAKELPDIKQGMKTQVYDNKPLLKDVPVLTKDRKVFYCDIMVSKVLFDGHDCILGVFHDVSDKKKLTDAVKDSEFRLQSLTDASMEGVCFHVEGIILDVNRQLPQMLGVMPIDMIGHCITDFVADESKKAFKARLDSRQGSSMEHMMKRSSGDGCFVETHFLETKYKGRDSGAIVIRDIDKRKRAENALKSEREFSSSLINTANAIIVILDDAGNVTFFNKYFEDVSGYSLNEVKGRSWIELFSKPSDKKNAEGFLAAAASQGKANGVVNTILLKDGREMIVEWHNKTMAQADGRTFVLAIGQDVTERVKMVENLRLSEQKMRQIIDNAPYGAYIYELQKDDRLVFTGYNKAAERILGVPHSGFIGRTIEELFPDLEKMGIPAAYREVARTGVSMGTVYVQYSAGGIDGTFEVVAFQHMPSSVTVFFRDVTESRKMEMLIRDSEERFRIVAKKTGEIIYDHDCLAGTILWSGAVQEITGFAEEEFAKIGFTHWKEMIHPGDMKAFEAERIRAGNGSGDFHCEYRIRHKDGRYIDIEDRGVFQDTAKAPRARMLGVVIDVTERKKTEQANFEIERKIMQTQKLASIEMLAGGIAHNFNNLLMVILGQLDLAMDELSPVSQARMNINEALASAKKAADLTRQLLSYVGRGISVPEKVNLADMVSDVLSLMRGSVSKGVKIELNLNRNIPFTTAHASQLQNIIVGLINNAQEAIGSRGGTIVISTGLQKCDESDLKANVTGAAVQPGEYVYLEVSDSGCGMTDKVKQNIFEPFFTTKEMGRGMGLPACLGVMKRLNGAIMFASGPEKGAVFKFMFPVSGALSDDVSMQPAKPSAGLEMLRGEVVLLEPDRGVRDLTSIMFTRLGFNVTVADDIDHACSICSERPEMIRLLMTALSALTFNDVVGYDKLAPLSGNIGLMITSSHEHLDLPEWLPADRRVATLKKPYKIIDLRDALVRLL